MKNSTEIKSKQIFETILQLGLVFLILGFCFRLLAPFAMPILWAIILAIAFYPVFDFLQKKLKGRKSLASFLITITLLGLIIVPAVIFFSSVTTSVLELKAGVEDGSLKIHTPSENIKDWPLIGNKAYDFLYSLSTDLKSGLLEYKAEIIEVSKTLLGTAVSSLATVLMVVLSIIIAGVFMASSSAQNLATNFIKRISGDSGDEFLNSCKVVAKS